MKIFIIILLLVGVSCAKNISRSIDKRGYVKNTNVPSSVFSATNDSLKFPEYKDSTIVLTYLGCGGFSFTRNQKTILIDPFFTNPNLPLNSTSFIKMKTDTEMVDTGMYKIPNLENNSIEAILVSHTHYDHLMDIPYVFEKYTNSDSTSIYCSQSSKNIINGIGAIKSSNVITLNYKTSTIDKVGERFYLQDSTIRITPIKSEHAPHLGRIKMYSGDAKTHKKYANSLSRSRACWWKEGETYAFVIDYLSNKSDIDFRIYIQSSAANMPHGWLPNSIKNESAINIAILGIASSGYVKNYPESLIDHLNPEKLILCHWEDFFRKYTKTPKTVRLTRIDKVIRRVDKVYPYQKDGEKQYSLPYPGVSISVN